MSWSWILVCMTDGSPWLHTRGIYHCQPDPVPFSVCPPASAFSLLGLFFAYSHPGVESTWGLYGNVHVLARTAS
ncbi:hypothetical protein F5148DRAFT_1196590 [Russula earlei]|uniref:Uncharacterized protein n=1 Tax=Russula earlei TaxID=71964 RepID=A0ACC0UBG0_9AGAM|nr:hypothetical protein F5148DRAFT_1196590 [Russula earlei]